MKTYEQKFYKSKAWRDVRDAVMIERGGLCEICGAPADEVHHKTALNSRNVTDPNIAYGKDNLMCLCRACHFEIHDKRSMIHRTHGHGRAAFDENGQPLPTKRNIIVWGSYGSGKSTYVKEHMREGDIVIDLDDMFICFTHRSPKNDDVSDMVQMMSAIREQIYRLLERADTDYLTAWIVAGLPKKREREQLAKRLNAELLYIDTSYSQCIYNAEHDGRRKNKEMQRKIIGDYFDNLEL